eukprot:9496198-Pyramimonas_sp.AAC.2
MASSASGCVVCATVVPYAIGLYCAKTAIQGKIQDECQKLTIYLPDSKGKMLGNKWNSPMPRPQPQLLQKHSLILQASWAQDISPNWSGTPVRS